MTDKQIEQIISTDSDFAFAEAMRINVYRTAFIPSRVLTNGTHSRTYRVGRMSVTVDEFRDQVGRVTLTGWTARFDAETQISNDLAGQLIRTENYQPGAIGKAIVDRIEHIPQQCSPHQTPVYHSLVSLRGIGEPPMGSVER